MKNFLLVFLFCCGVSITFGQKYTYKTYKNDPTGLRLYTLDNGLQVYLAQNKDEPKIQTFIAVRAGSNYDPTENTGLAHYLEHMLFKGTHKIGTIEWEVEKPYLDAISQLYEDHKAESNPDKKKAIYQKIDSLSYEASKKCIANDYDKMLSSLGAEGTNAHTWFEETVYKNKIPSNQFDKWLSIESERFSTLVLRLFHTELEAVYEEFNRAQDNEYRNVYAAQMKALFPNHPYGQQTTIGTSEHLKNPSMVAIHDYFNTYYVPNNMAMVLVGDLDFDETIAKVDAHFGKMKRKEVTHPTLPKEMPLTQNIQKEISGPSSPNFNMSFRFNGINTKDAQMVTLIDMLLNNSTAGLIDLNLNQQQKVLHAGCSPTFMNDYGWHSFYGQPKEGQSLKEVESLILGEIQKIKNGEFDDWMIPAVINDLKLSNIRQFTSSTSTATMMYDAFIHHQDWQDVVDFNNDLEKITKKDLIDFANKYYQYHVSIYKNQGENLGIVKVENPGITPIETNRGKVSQFAQAIYEAPSQPLYPAFVDYNTAIQTFNVGNLKINAVENPDNDLFYIDYIFDIGRENDKKLALAVNYLEYLGTDTMSAEEVKKEFYKLGINYGVFAGDYRSYVYISGLRQNMEQGLKLFESLLSSVTPDKEAYLKLVDKIMKERQDAQTQKGSIFWSGMYRKAMYGDQSPNLTRLTKAEMLAIAPNELCEMIHDFSLYRHEVFYYGKEPTKIGKLISKYHKTPSNWNPNPPRKTPAYQAFDNKVYFYDYDMVQTEMAFIAKDVPFNVNNLAQIEVFNEYFGSGLSSIVFQEIRESKSLAYTAYCYYNIPIEGTKPHFLISYVGTQANKLSQAVDAMQELLNNLPKSMEQFEAAKSSALKKIEAARITKDNLYWSYLDVQDLGLKGDYRKAVYERIKSMTFDDLQTFFDAHIKGKKFNYFVIGNKKDMNIEALQKLGKVEELSLDSMFK